MNKFRKIKLASAMLCTLLFGGNAGAMQKYVSKGISSDKLKDDLLKGQTENKELENRKPGDSDNKLLEYILCVLVGVKLADEGVGAAEAKEYIEHRELSPLGKLSIYKNLVARSYRAKTIGTMRNLVDKSRKNAENIEKFSNGVISNVAKVKNNKNGCAKVRNNLFDISLAAAGNNYLDIKSVCYNAGLTKNDKPEIPEYVEEYVKAVLGVSVEQCDKILVELNKYNRYIAFVRGNICLKLSLSDGGIGFLLTGISEQLDFDDGDYELDLYEGNNCYAISLPYMEKILGVKHDEHYINIKGNTDKINNYSFYGQIFRDLFNDWKGNTPSGKEFMGQADKIFPDLFPKKEELIELKEE